MKSNFTIARSDLVYLWDDCRRCFYDHVKNGLELPRSFSPHFTNADRAMRRAIAEHEVVDLGVGPPFRVIAQGEWVESRPIPFAAHGLSLSFRGQIDGLVATGSGDAEELWVVDYKTTTLEDAQLVKFRRQLMSYVVAIEQPASECLGTRRYVDGTALIVFDPSKFVFNAKTKWSGLCGLTRWVELPRRDHLFDQFLSRVAACIASASAPPSDPKCTLCRLRRT